MNDIIEAPPASSGLVSRMADRYGIEAGKFLATIKATAFRVPPDKPPITNEQLAALLMIAERHRLDPFTKEIYAYPDKGGGIVPVIGIDGWLRIINEHPQFDGMECHWDDNEASMTCTIWRKDRRHPIRVTEYLSECRRDTAPWRMVHRMMRHKATMQCARYAFGFSDLHDDDEAQDILSRAVSASIATPAPALSAPTALETVRDILKSHEPEPVPESSPIGDPPMEDEPADLPIKDGGPPKDTRSPKPPPKQAPAPPPFDAQTYAARIEKIGDVDLLVLMREEIASLPPSVREDMGALIDARIHHLVPTEGETS